MKNINKLILLLAFAFSMPAVADRIYVDKSKFTLTVFDDNNNPKASFKVGVGRNYGNKKAQGDLKTPEGKFSVVRVENSSRWAHTYNDWKGPGPGPYGPKFIRLRTPGSSGIGIHGTNEPELIGTRCSEGCVRMFNDDVVKLAGMVVPGMVVEISSDSTETYVAPKFKPRKSTYKSSKKGKSKVWSKSTSYAKTYKWGNSRKRYKSKKRK